MALMFSGAGAAAAPGRFAALTCSAGTARVEAGFLALLAAEDAAGDAAAGAIAGDLLRGLLAPAGDAGRFFAGLRLGRLLAGGMMRAQTE